MKSSYSFGTLTEFALKPAQVGKWQLKHLYIKEQSIKTLYHVCQDGTTVSALMWEVVDLKRL